MMSPYDEIAVEEALRMRDKFKGEVTVISLGGEQAQRNAEKGPCHGGRQGRRCSKMTRIGIPFGVAKGLAEET